MKVVSFFSGCGGLDLGFEQAGFEVVWANDNDPAVKGTYILNHPGTYLCQKDMRELTMGEIPESDGLSCATRALSRICNRYKKGY